MGNIKKLASKESWKAALKKPKSKDWTEVVTNTTLDVLAGIAGGIGGSFLGWVAIPAGITISAFGHYSGHRWMSAMGIGVIAAPLTSIGRKAEGAPFNLKDEFEAGKQRAKEYVTMLKDKFFVNKFMGKNKPAGQTNENPDGQVVNGLDPGIEKATLDKLTEFDEQIVSEGIEYQAKRSTPADNSAAYPVNGVQIEFDELPHII